MSNNHSARESDIDVEAEALDDDADESLVADRQPRAPSITRLGRYRLVREIASGGMATVNLAVAEGLDKLVALKIIHPHLAQEESFVHMFLDEARLASAISHRNVCNVFDFGECDGRFYIAMDYLSGQSLRDVLRRLRRTDLQIEPRRLAVYVAYMIAEACEGLHAAHELHGSDGQSLNVVHRDVSPHNLFVTYDGNVSVVDFGIARASDRIQSTATGVLKGKFSYMAPEQMRQMEIDRRADIWALGVVLWESLTLQRLFVRSSQADTVMSVMMDKIRPPSEVKPDLPKELDAIALRAIARSPAHRFPTAREMGRELMKFCRESGVMVSPIEIEHFMERLFEKEIGDAKQLERKAKHSGHESGVWMEVTPSGFARVPLRSLQGDRVVWKNPLQAQIDKAKELADPISKRPVATSQTAPAAEARATAHPEIPQFPDTPKKKRMARVVAAACATCAALVGLWIGLRPPRVEPLAATSAVDSQPAPAAQPAPQPQVPPTPSLAMKGPDPVPPEKPTPAAEPTPPPAPRTGAIAPQRYEPPRRDVRGRPAARGAANNNAAARESASGSANDAGGAPRTVSSDELAMRGTEATASAPLTVPEARDEAPPPPPPPVAPTVHVQPAVPPVVSAAPPAAAKPAPAAPQRLEAQASVTELDVEGSLGSGVVARMLGRATPVVKGCYADAAKRAARNDFSPLTASLLIDESGAVRQVNVSRHGLGDLSGCAANALKHLRTERVPDVGTVQVRFKITFNP